MSGQCTVRPVSATLNQGGTIGMEIRPGALYNCTSVGLRPKNKDVNAVFEDIQARIARGDKCRLGDMSWSGGASKAWFFEYREKIAGQKRAKSDPDAAVLRDHEMRNGIG